MVLPALVGRCRNLLLIAAAGLFLATALKANYAWADGETTAQTITVIEQTGRTVAMQTLFYNEQGASVTLGNLLDKPVLLLPIYYTCPNSCSTNLANLAIAMRQMKLQPGIDYRAVALSFNNREGVDDARRAKQNYLKLLDGFPAEQWSFLTGSKTAVDSVLKSIGFSYKELADGTFIHPSMLVALATDGTIIKYVYGTFIPGDVEIAIAEAKKGIPAVSIKRFLNYCFNYEPGTANRIFQWVKVVTLTVFVVALAVFFIRFLRKRGSGEQRDCRLHPKN